MVHQSYEQEPTPIFNSLSVTMDWAFDSDGLSPHHLPEEAPGEEPGFVRRSGVAVITGERSTGSSSYLSQAARIRIEQAEFDLYQHLTVSPGGLCTGCSEPEPCRARYDALKVLDGYGVLPKRRAGVAGVQAATRTQTFAGFAASQTRSNDAM
jgi:hypothetical protein